MGGIDNGESQNKKPTDYWPYLIRIIIRYRWILLIVAIVATIVNAVFTMNKEAAYSFSTEVRPGKFIAMTTGIERNLVTPEDLAEQIKSPNFQKSIADELQIDPDAMKSLKVRVIRNSGSVRISWIGNIDGPGIDILQSLIRKITTKKSNNKEVQGELLRGAIDSEKKTVAKNKQDIVGYEEAIKKNKVLFESAMKGYREKIGFYEKNIEEATARVEELIALKKSIESNTEKLMNEHLDRSTSESETKQDTLNQLFFLDLLQRNLSLSSQASSDLYSARQNLQNYMIGIEEVKKAMDDYRSAYNRELMTNNTIILNRQLAIDTNQKDIAKYELYQQILNDLEVRQPPQRSLNPLSSMLIMTSVATFCIALFLTLFVLVLLERYNGMKSSATQ